MTLLQLQYFVTLARVLHYTRAAEELHIAQPSLSYSIRELEKELGVNLFEKEARKVTITPYGEKFLQYARKALDLLDKGRETLRQMSANELQYVRLAYFQSIAVNMVPAIVEGIYAQAPGIDLRFKFDEAPSHTILDMLNRGDTDLALCLIQEPWAESVPVLRQPLYLAVHKHHPLADRVRADIEEVLHEPMIMLYKQSGLRRQMDDIFERYNVMPNISFEVRECNAALQYVALNFGVAILPKVPAMESELVSIIPLEERGRPMLRTAYLVWDRKRALSSAVQLVRDYIIDHYALP